MIQQYCLLISSLLRIVCKQNGSLLIINYLYIMSNKKITIKTAEKLGLNENEFNKIEELLGRKPNYTELYIFSIMWSEIISNKSSIKWLSRIKAYNENLNYIDIDDELIGILKIESYNNSSIKKIPNNVNAIVGVNRRVYTEGFRPIAQLNSLKFGDLNSKRTKFDLQNIILQTGNYINSLGVPIINGDVSFNSRYGTNYLVNTMSVGLRKKTLDNSFSYKKGHKIYAINPIIEKSNENININISETKIEDSYHEKILMEAILETIDLGLAIKIQDISKGSIINTAFKISDSTNCGIKIDLSKFSINDNIETPEILFSKFNEKMLIVCNDEIEDKLLHVFDKWDLKCNKVGELIKEKKVQFYTDKQILADIPSKIMEYSKIFSEFDNEASEPEYNQKIKSYNIKNIAMPEDMIELAQNIIENPNIASRNWIYEQYDTMIGTANMITNFPSDAGVINLKNSKKALSIVVSANSRYVNSNPRIGTQIVIAEAARKIICSGAKPIAFSSGLNFGNPDNPEVYWQFLNVSKGINKSIKRLEIPITDINMSFHNEANIEGQTKPIFPTPVIGMLGILEDKNNQMTTSFKNKGDIIFLIGESRNDISSSEYLASYHNVDLSPTPYFNPEKEYKLQEVVKGVIEKKLVRSAHSLSIGGLYASLIESCMTFEFGCDIMSDSDIRIDSFLFGEAQSRVLLSVTPNKEANFIDYMIANKIPCLALGHVTKGEIRVDGISYGFIKDIKKSYNNALENLILSK